MIDSRDLTEPIAIARSNRTPEGDSAFKETLAPYFRGWAKVKESIKQEDEGVSTDATAITLFTIRDPRQSIELRDYVIWGERMFAVTGTKTIGRRRDFVTVYTVEDGEIDTEKDLTTLDPVNAQEPDVAANPFWDEGEASLPVPSPQPVPTGRPIYAHVHDQLVAATVWTVNHNLGYKPSIELVTSAGQEFDAEVIHVNVNQAMVYITVPMAGQARCL